jgi:hypothetical protein
VIPGDFFVRAFPLGLFRSPPLGDDLRACAPRQRQLLQTLGFGTPPRSRHLESRPQAAARLDLEVPAGWVRSSSRGLCCGNALLLTTHGGRQTPDVPPSGPSEGRVGVVPHMVGPCQGRVSPAPRAACSASPAGTATPSHAPQLLPAFRQRRWHGWGVHVDTAGR